MTTKKQLERELKETKKESEDWYNLWIDSDKKFGYWAYALVGMFFLFIILLVYSGVQQTNIKSCEEKGGKIELGFINKCILPEGKIMVEVCENFITEDWVCNFSTFFNKFRNGYNDEYVDFIKAIHENNYFMTCVILDINEDNKKIICEAKHGKVEINNITTQNCTLITPEEYMDKQDCEEFGEEQPKFIKKSNEGCCKNNNPYLTSCQYIVNDNALGELTGKRFIRQVKCGEVIFEKICTKKSAQAKLVWNRIR